MKSARNTLRITGLNTPPFSLCSRTSQPGPFSSTLQLISLGMKRVALAQSISVDQTTDGGAATSMEALTDAADPATAMACTAGAAS